MSLSSDISLSLGLLIFSFIVTGVFIVPFINLLYKLKLTRRKEAPKKGKIPLFDKLHDKKAGTPVGGGILIIIIISAIFALLFPFASRMGILIESIYPLDEEIFLIFFTLISFGLLGLYDDVEKMFGKARKGSLGMWLGLSRRKKFTLQWLLGIIIGYFLYYRFNINFLHIPLLDIDFNNIGPYYIFFHAFVIVSFSNAFNITDGLDGLSSGLLIICLIAFGVISGNLDLPLSLFISIWIGSLIAFLYFNIWPARIMLGDVGSLSFGAMLGLIGLMTGNIVALLVIGGIFVVEILSSAIQILGWKILKRPLLPLAPLHHAFLAVGWEEPKIVMRAWLTGMILAIFGLWLASI